MGKVLHGHRHRGRVSRTAAAWLKAKQRCTNPNDPKYPIYGGRGVTMCERWAHSFRAFLADMGERPPALTLERIDNSRGYEPGNCRWATRKAQARNTRRNHLITVDGVEMCIAEAAEKLGLKAATLYQRVYRGWAP